MNEENNYKTFWHQPSDSPKLGTVQDIEKCLQKNNIEFKTEPSFMKNHVAFSVQKKDIKVAQPLIENTFGRLY